MFADERFTTVVSTKGSVNPAQGRAPASRLAGGHETGGRGSHHRRSASPGAAVRKTQLSDVFAMLKTDGRRRTLDEMDAAVVEEARRRDAGD
ncbi:hypothetical protein [Rhodoblastus sp.]|jgi:hypothetical protein|uniref:hypothetical protein n=1 Tax=Rhodoblastus sp. TaxID=1962975 RepID=UPI003144D62A